MARAGKDKYARGVRSGGIWRKAPRLRGQVVRRVCERLRRTYGLPRFGNPTYPLDDLIYIVLSNRTAPTTARQVYARLKTVFPSWGAVLLSRRSKLVAVLRPAGLSHIKSRQIRAALRKIQADFGRCDLSGLKECPESEVYGYLTALPGVSDKVAKCVMMYTMDAKVLPVDVHVYRVSKRLGWVSRKRADQCHEELEALVPPSRRHAFHVDCIAHGREVCRPGRPLCHRCPIRNYCEYYKSIVCRDPNVQ